MTTPATVRRSAIHDPDHELRHELRIGRTQRRPRCVRFGRFRRWRWDVTTYRAIDGRYPGVLDTRWHLGGQMGWALTRAGAAAAAGRWVDRYAERHAQRLT